MPFAYNSGFLLPTTGLGSNVGYSGYLQNGSQTGYNPGSVGSYVSPGVTYGTAADQAALQQRQNSAAQANSYQQQLRDAQADYGNMVSGYQRQLGLIDSSNQSRQTAYTQLLNQLLGGIAGVEQPARQASYDDYLRNLGSQRQSLVSRGMNNTTVRDSVERGVLSDKWRRDNEITAQMAQLRAGYEQSIGLAGLGAQNEAQAQRNALELQYAQMRQQADQYTRGLESQYQLAMLGRGGGGGYSGGGGGGGGRVYPQDSRLNSGFNIGGAYGGYSSDPGYGSNFGSGYNQQPGYYDFAQNQNWTPTGYVSGWSGGDFAVEGLDY